MVELGLLDLGGIDVLLVSVSEGYLGMGFCFGKS